MSSYREARSLVQLKREVDNLWPGRDTASDGWVGDRAHFARGSSSDHNPWVIVDGIGVVRARDVDAGWQNDVSLGAALHRSLLDIAHRNAHPALGPGAYVIFRGHIYSHARGWRKRVYDGPNAHLGHLHLSVTLDPQGFDSGLGWQLHALVPQYLPTTYHRRSTDMTPEQSAQLARTVQLVEHLAVEQDMARRDVRDLAARGVNPLLAASGLPELTVAATHSLDGVIES